MSAEKGVSHVVQCEDPARTKSRILDEDSERSLISPTVENLDTSETAHCLSQVKLMVD